MLLLTLYSLLSLGSPDTNVVLKPVEIMGDRFEVMTGGRNIEQCDSISKGAMNHSSLDQLLEFNSSMYVKNYGPGTLSSLTMRGGSSYHTAVLWNGFQITNPMNGQLDFSLLQNFFFDRFEIQRGGGGTLWGSGAVSGVVNLRDNFHFNRGVDASLSATTNSFGNLREMVSASYGNSRLSMGIKLFNDYSPNKFEFIKNEVRTTQTHSLCKSSGALADFGYLTGKNSSLAVGLWMQSSDRQIGPLMTQVQTDASQSDESFRLTGEWKIESGNNYFAIRSAYMIDKIDYNDSLLDFPSNGRDKHFVTEGEYRYEFNKHHLLFAGFNFDHNTAVTNEYEKEITLERKATYLAYRFSLTKFIFNASVRKEFSSLNNPPLIYSGGFSFLPINGLEILVSTGNVFRNPTMNDLYWKPGGNLTLLPESGFTFDGTMRIDLLALSHSASTKASFVLEGTYFTKKIDNWIAWTPSGSYWRPMNIKSVDSHGEEFRIKTNYSGSIVKCGLNFEYSHTNASTTSSIYQQDESIGKQLIYVPFDKLTTRLFIEFKNFRLSWWHSYTNFRFISSDNEWALPAYDLDHVQIEKQILLNQYRLNIFCRVNNLFDIDYQVVENHPEPLRNFEAGVSINFHQNKN